MSMYQQLKSYQDELIQKMNFHLQNKNYHLKKIIAQLDALSPLKVMHRGYSLVKKNNQVIQSIHDLHQGEIVDIQMVDGIKKAEIK